VGRYDPDLKVVYSTSAFPDAGTYRGGRVALDAWNRWLDAWEEFSMEFVDLIDAGEEIHRPHPAPVRKPAKPPGCLLSTPLGEADLTE
jgi:hypothetical protein